jgi:hypothetical protein
MREGVMYGIPAPTGDKEGEEDDVVLWNPVVEKNLYSHHCLSGLPGAVLEKLTGCSSGTHLTVEKKNSGVFTGLR